MENEINKDLKAFYINITEELYFNNVDKIDKINHTIEVPEVRVSHQIKGRTADAIYKSVKELLDHEKTQYFERMAFIIRIPSITEKINGNDVALTVGGVRAYNQKILISPKRLKPRSTSTTSTAPITTITNST